MGRIGKILAAAAIAPAALALVVVGAEGPARAATNTSTNWSGYSVSALSGSSPTPVMSVSATWTVPTATQHTANQAEQSATWTGIGGGCIDSGCNAADNTLIQAGTEQDVAADGTASYSAWWETVPVPSVTVPLAVKAGDKMQVTISQVAPEVWHIAISDLTTQQSTTASVDPTPYSSDFSTAEFIDETPLSVGTSGAGLTALPNLSSTSFDDAMINGQAATLSSADAIDLVDSSGKVIATPSAPDANSDGFDVCTWATSCAVPGT